MQYLNEVKRYHNIDSHVDWLNQSVIYFNQLATWLTIP